MNRAQAVGFLFLLFFVVLLLRQIQLKARSRRLSNKFSIDKVYIETLDWNAVEDSDRERIWSTKDACSVMIQYSPVPARFPQVSTLQEFHNAITRSFEGSQRTVVEVGLLQFGSIGTIYYIFKAPMKPNGMEYWCEVIFPFKEFELKIMIFSPEQGLTGIREAILLDRRLASDERSRREFANGKLPENWSPDDPQFDKEFPHHPVSKIRHWLNHIQKNTRINYDIKALSSYHVPKA